jgi:hypothetical protein
MRVFLLAVAFSATFHSVVFAGPVFSTSASSFVGAQNVNGNFTLNALDNVFASTTIPHVEIIQIGQVTAGYDFYWFTHNGGTVHVDIDGPTNFDTEIGIWDAAGTLLDNNDDCVCTDPGTTVNTNSLLQNLNLVAGDYIVGVAMYNSGFFAGRPYITGPPVPFTGHYVLNISANTDAVPEPLSIGLTGLGMLVLGALRLHRKA